MTTLEVLILIATGMFLVDSLWAVVEGRSTDAKASLGVAALAVLSFFLGPWTLWLAGVGVAVRATSGRAVPSGTSMGVAVKVDRERDMAEYQSEMAELGDKIVEGTANDQMLLKAIDLQDELHRRYGHSSTEQCDDT